MNVLLYVIQEADTKQDQTCKRFIEKGNRERGEEHPYDTGSMTPVGREMEGGDTVQF